MITNTKLSTMKLVMMGRSLYCSALGTIKVSNCGSTKFTWLLQQDWLQEHVVPGLEDSAWKFVCAAPITRSIYQY
jgi:hypothetical protein